MAGTLKPCPFCGSSRIESIFIRDGRAIACGCGAATRAFQPDAERKAREAWNHRVAVPVTADTDD